MNFDENSFFLMKVKITYLKSARVRLFLSFKMTKQKIGFLLIWLKIKRAFKYINQLKLTS